MILKIYSNDNRSLDLGQKTQGGIGSRKGRGPTKVGRTAGGLLSKSKTILRKTQKKEPLVNYQKLFIKTAATYSPTCAVPSA